MGINSHSSYHPQLFNTPPHNPRKPRIGGEFSHASNLLSPVQRVKTKTKKAPSVVTVAAPSKTTSRQKKSKTPPPTKSVCIQGVQQCSGAASQKQFGSPFYRPGRQLINSPVEPFKVFMDESNVLAKIVWLYLLEVMQILNVGFNSQRTYLAWTFQFHL